jgi:hypothetical protein
VILGVLSHGVKRLRREADDSPPSSSHLKNCVARLPYIYHVLKRL